MATLLQCIDEFIDNITVTDKQEANIKASVAALTDYLEKEESNLHITDTFTNGSYERDTNIRPLDDIDVFAVLDSEEYLDEFGRLPSPQSVLTKMKNWLEKNDDYKGKVGQDRPCVSIELSNKRFEIIPSFVQNASGSYWIPNEDLSGWIITSPDSHTNRLNDVNASRKYLVKKVIKAVKKWKRDAKLNLPSFHTEEVAIDLFFMNDITNIRDGIEKWFKYAPNMLQSSRFKSTDEYQKAVDKIKKVDKAFTDAKQLEDEADVIAVWKKIFDTDFPVTTTEEDKAIAKSLKEGTLKMASGGALGAVGKIVPPNKGFYGEK
jgi:hypothetical protein